MVVVVVVVAAVLAVILFVGAVAVIRESARMDREPPTRPFDFQAAVDWVVQHIPDDVAATLTLDDVHRILDLQLDYFRRKGVSRNGQTAEPRGTVIVGGSETVEYIVEEAAAQGFHYKSGQVHAVIDTQLAYLRSIGAIGPRVGDAGPAGEPPEGDDPAGRGGPAGSGA